MSTLLSVLAVAFLASCSSGGSGSSSSSSTQYTTLNYTGSLASGGATGLTGIRQVGDTSNVYITGSYVLQGYSNGTLYVGPITGGGTYYVYNFPSSSGATVSGTNVYSAADSETNGNVRLTGTYTTTQNGAFAYGFYYNGPVTQNPTSGWQQLVYPSSAAITVQNTYPHSIMGDLIVGNYDSVQTKGNAFIYNIAARQFKTISTGPAYTSAYGVWDNGNGRYTIVGGYSDNPVQRNSESVVQLTQGYVVDYNANTEQFSNWTSFNYNNTPSTDVFTHFEGITSDGNGGYNLAAGWYNGAIGASFVHITRNSDGSFNPQATWINVNYPNSQPSTTTADTVYQNYLLGVYQGSGGIAQLNGYVANIPGGYFY